MPYVLLFLLFISTTCFAHGEQCDSVAQALVAIPKQSIVTISHTGQNQLQLPYKYDNSKTLVVDLSKKTVKLVNDRQEIFAEGQYVQPDATSQQMYPTGHWRYYHSNGKLKCEGDYIVAPHAWAETQTVKNTATGKAQTKTEHTVKYTVVQTGDWQHYNAAGQHSSTEYFD